MRRPAIIGGIALAVVVGTVMPAQADTPRPVTLNSKGRFTHFDAHSIGKIKNLPASLRPDATVTALVQLTGDPVTIQQQKADQAHTSFDRAAARRRVQTEQSAVTPQLRAAGASVQGGLTTVLNAVRVRVKARDLAKVAAVAGVRQVQVSRTITRDNGSADAYTGTDQTWQDLGLTGKGMVIGVIDDGIDYTHADFGGPGTPQAYSSNDRTKIEPGTFPTAKVIGGYDFVGDAYDASSSDPALTVPQPDPDPLACGEHGTHVSGTAAGFGVTADGHTYTGPYNASTLSATSFEVAPGSAPEADLRIYKVFGCSGSVDDSIVAAAIDSAVADGVDVINMSLGSTFGTVGGLDTQAVDNATAGGVLVVSAAGNEGPGAYVTGSPGSADTGLSVAAMDASQPTFPGIDFSGGVTAHALNANGATLSSITGQLVAVSGDGLGCSAADYAGTAGKIVLTTRGVCARIDRATFGQQAGALAVIMVNNAAGLPPFEGGIPGVTIPFVGVDGNDAAAFAAAVGSTVTLTAGAAVTNTSYGRFADFSSSGPRRLDSALKPDLTAPGVSVLSAGVGLGTGGIRLSGTSMATPHTTGIAALARQGHPTWSPAQVKAALVSTADPSKVLDFTTVRGGTGLVQPRTASDTVAYAWTPEGLDNLSFGLKVMSGAQSLSRSYRITNTSGHAISYRLSTQLSSPSYGAGLRLSPSSLTVPAHATRTVTLTISLSKSAVAALPAADASDAGALVSLAGAVVATPRSSGTGVYPLRTAFLLVPKAASEVIARGPELSRRATAPSGDITLRNFGVHSGDADVYAWELTDRSGDTTDPEVADIVDVGVQSLPADSFGVPGDKLLVFAVNEAKPTSTQATHEVDIAIDTNGDGQPDYYTFSADTGLVTAGTPDGTVSSFTVDAAGNLVDWWDAIAPMNGSVVEMPVLAGSLGLTSSAGAFSFTATGYTVLGGSGSDATGTATFDAFHPVVSTGGFASLAPRTTGKVAVTVDRSQLATQTARGWLVVTLDDRSGRAAADPVPLHQH